MSCFTYTNLVDQASALNPDPNSYLYRSSHTLLQQQNALSPSVRFPSHQSPFTAISHTNPSCRRTHNI